VSTEEVMGAEINESGGELVVKKLQRQIKWHVFMDRGVWTCTLS